MSTPILATKLYVPPPRPRLILRPRLIERLNEGLGQNRDSGRKLTLVSAAAGFGKTTLISEWVAGCGRPVAWVSLDEGDNDPARFLAYFVAALQTIVPSFGDNVLSVLQSPQPPPIESTLTVLLNEIATIPSDFILVLDDYHVVATQAVDNALAFLLEHLPPQMHLVIATRENPPLPLARYRVRGQLTELRAADLRFTTAEAADFLNQDIGLNLSVAEIDALESRTEGWIAGLQLAALALQGQSARVDERDSADFIQSFTGSHRFVLDYLVEEVLQQQPDRIQDFLLHTAILDRLCGPLCDAVLAEPVPTGQETLAYLERANLFVIPLDNERRWYRYHHLFGELLRQRLQQRAALSSANEESSVAAYHLRASQWYEANGLEVEAFQHAVAAEDVPRAAQLIEGEGMPLHYRGAGAPVLNWLGSLPTAVLDARPALWVTFASASTMAGQPIAGVEQKLQAAEAALQLAEPDDTSRDLVGQIAAIRAMLAIPTNEIDVINVQSRRALEFLHPDNLSARTNAAWTLGFAFQMQGDRAAAIQAYNEAITTSLASGNTMVTIAATTCLGQVQEVENQLFLAEETFRRGLQLTGDPPLPAACEMFLGLARIHYQWDDLDMAEAYGQQCVALARQLPTVDTAAIGEVLLARLKLSRGDVAGADVLLTKAEAYLRERQMLHRLPNVVAVQVLSRLRLGEIAVAVRLAEMHALPLSLARVHLAQADPVSALAVLAPWRRQMAAKGWPDECLQVLVLQAIAHQASGATDQANQDLREALALAQPGGFIRIFADEGPPMAALLSGIEDADQTAKAYRERLLAAFRRQDSRQLPSDGPQLLLEPLSPRELEVLQLVAQGLSNREIGARLFLALDTVKGHNRRIYGKLQVQRRTEAVARARELDLL